MKILGSIMIIGATTLFGCRMAMDMDESFREIKYLRQMMYMLESEIRYSNAYLAEAFQHLSRNAREPYGAWLRQLHYRMMKKSGGTFEKLWGETIQEYLISSKLPEKEFQKLVELGQYLGDRDTRMQQKHIELFIEQLDLTMQEMREEMKSKKRLCHCLGVMSGIFLAILLV